MRRKFHWLQASGFRLQVSSRSPRPAARSLLVLPFVFAAAVSSQAQVPQPKYRLTFREAVEQAIARNPTVAEAAAGILQAEGLLRQSRAAYLPRVTATVTTTTLNTGVEFNGATVTPRNQVAVAGSADVPIVAAAAWARRAQAADERTIAVLTADDRKRQTALATADAYLAVIAQHRVLDANLRARDVAKAHFDLAAQLERGGTGSRLNTLRAQQQQSTDEQLVESASLALYRAQEALGVLVVADGAVDAADDPAFEVEQSPQAASAASLAGIRSDLKLFSAQQQAAERVVRDSSKDYWPTLDALFQPQTQYPAPFFLPGNSWQFLLQARVNIFDSGQRASQRVQRQAALDLARASLAGGLTQASSQVRAAREAVASGERSLSSARDAAQAAQQVVTITNVAFRAGAATNIEVIDAERAARDADTAVAVAEDTLRRARLELLDALGRFP
jgi:outer membrane protein